MESFKHRYEIEGQDQEIVIALIELEEDYSQMLIKLKSNKMIKAMDMVNVLKDYAEKIEAQIKADFPEGHTEQGL